MSLDRAKARVERTFHGVVAGDAHCSEPNKDDRCIVNSSHLTAAGAYRKVRDVQTPTSNENLPQAIFDMLEWKEKGVDVGYQDGCLIVRRRWSLRNRFLVGGRSEEREPQQDGMRYQGMRIDKAYV
jgi:hypothetical protein